MEGMIIELLVMLLIALVNFGLGYLITWLKKKKILTDLKAHEELVRIAVKAVQESNHTESGKIKFDKAKEWIVEVAQQKGLKGVTEKEIDFLIDSVVKELKKEFGEAWKEA